MPGVPVVSGAGGHGGAAHAPGGGTSDAPSQAARQLPKSKATLNSHTMT